MADLQYIGLLFGCPFKKCTMNCPYRHIRKLLIDKRYKLYKRLDKSTKDRLINTHLKCFHERESGFIDYGRISRITKIVKKINEKTS